ncbi:MAG: His-Xaa-Ser system radical SAM maturase HxsB, partial [Rhabdochlamydiaceae bacterium]
MGQACFEKPDFYKPKQAYRLLPFQFMDFAPQTKLVANEVGEYLVLGDPDFEAFVSHRLNQTSDTYCDLKAKHFLYDSDSGAPLNLLSIKYRTKKSFLAGFTKLHIFVVSLRCEHSYAYCQVSRVSMDKPRYDMSPETASRALDLVFRSRAPEVKIEFQGGEPLLNFERIKQIVEEAEARSASSGKGLEFVVCSNLA